MSLAAKNTILLTFAAFGGVIGTHVGAMPFLITASGISPYAFGFIGAIGMVANISAMSLGGFVNRHADHRSVLLVMLPLCYAALWYALLVNSVVSFGLSFIFLSAALGTFDLFMNAEGAAVEQELGRTVFSSYHGSASLGMALFAIISSLVSVYYAPWFVAVFAGIPLVLAWAAIFKNIPKRPLARHVENAKPIVLPRGILTLVGLAAGLNVACEGAAILWAGQLLTSIAPNLAAISGLGLAFYGLCGGIMRLLVDGLRSRHGDLRVMVMSIAMGVAGFSVLGMAPGFWLSVIAFAAVGCGLAVTFPCLFSLAGKIVPHGRAAAMSYVATIGGAPRVLLPWLLGYIASTVSLGGVFAACGIVATAAMAIIILIYRQSHKLVPPA
jgi:hypothetical protein